jgi:hypothetical protein
LLWNVFNSSNYGFLVVEGIGTSVKADVFQYFVRDFVKLNAGTSVRSNRGIDMVARG